MNDRIHWLLTILYGGTVLKCALDIDRNFVSQECRDNPMAEKSREEIRTLLPPHIRSAGPILLVEELFDVVVLLEAPRQEFVRREGHNFCEIHQQEYLEYCSGCALERITEQYDVDEEGEFPAETPACWCHRCAKEQVDSTSARTTLEMRMIVCPVCGNKRCPRASDHRNKCTGSNEPGQPGSIYST